MVTMHTQARRRNWLSKRGAALIEAAVTMPILLLVAVGIFEFGRAYQTWQILTNAAREAARVSVLPNSAPDNARTVARNYMESGQLDKYADASIDINQNATIEVNGANVSASQVTVQYPFDFILLQPVAALISDTPSGGSLTMVASAVMRNESGN